MRNVVVGATVAATSVSFVSAGKPALFQATPGTQKFCSDPSFTGNGGSFTIKGTPVAGTNSASKYFLVPVDKYMAYKQPNDGYDVSNANYMGLDFTTASHLCDPKETDCPFLTCGKEPIFTDKRCLSSDFNVCDQTIPKLFNGHDICGVTEDNGSNKLVKYITKWGVDNWENVAAHDCCPYDQVFGLNLTDYFSHYVQHTGGKQFDKNNCESLYKGFLDAFDIQNPDAPHKNVVKTKCSSAYQSYWDGSMCQIEPK